MAGRGMEALRTVLDEMGARYRMLEPFMLKAGWVAQPCDYWTLWVYRPAPPMGEGLAPFAEKMELSVIPETDVPAPHRDAVVRLMNLVNWTLSLGSWELDASDGQIRFRITLLLDAESPDDLPAYVMALVAHEMGRTMPAILSVASGDATPEAAQVFLQDPEDLGLAN